MIRDALIVLGGIAVFGGDALAQRCRTDSSATAVPAPRTLVGVVASIRGEPLDSVEVTLGSPRRTVLTATDGSFRFGDLKPGNYDVIVRRLGYNRDARQFVVGDKGGVALFCLVPAARTLAPVVSSASRGGLSGVTGDTAYAIVPGADVVVIGEGQRTVSDSTGAFYLPLKRGKYIVRISRPGFAAQMMSVTIPDDSGRKIAVWLTPSPRGESRFEAMAMENLRERLINRRPARSAIYTREDIVTKSMTELVQFVRLGAVTSVPDDCMATVDGGRWTAPLWQFKAEEIEMIEVYVGPPPRGGVSSLGGNRPIPTQGRAGGSSSCPRVFVWLRK